VVGVLEFFACDADEPDPVLLEGLEQFGTQLGRVYERAELERHVADVSANEKRRIGQELHDNLGQLLAGLGAILQSLSKKLSAQPSPLADRAEMAVNTCADAQKVMRALVRGMIPLAIEQHGLAVALEELARSTQDYSGVACDFQGDQGVDVGDDHAATHLYRIAQEALSNAVRHGKPKHVTVRLRRDGEQVVLEIEDDGVGIKADATGAAGMGARIMHYRAGVVGAALLIESRGGKGCLVRCTLPARKAN
jgi:signal transduction histidine kinase